MGLGASAKSHSRMFRQISPLKSHFATQEGQSMKTITRCVCAALGLCAGLGMAAAQETENTTPPPTVLVVDREFTKPGKGGSGHDKSESALVQAFAQAKWPTNYFAANSMTGKNRVLFCIGYDSFEAWEKDNASLAKNATLSSEID